MASIDNNTPSKASSTIDKQTTESLVASKAQFINEIFPLYDQIMHSTVFPEWFSSLCSIFLSFQILNIEFWIYAPPFDRCQGKWRDTYIIISKIFAFQNPVDYTRAHLPASYVCLAVAIFSILWLRFVIRFSKKYYAIPSSLLYLSAIIIDMLTPLFLVPSAYSVSHGIVCIHNSLETEFIAEIIIGSIAYITILCLFIIGILLKSRSVVLTNLTFQVYDPPTVLLFFVLTTIALIATAIFKFFDSWFYVLIAVLHLCIGVTNCYRITFMPFYTLFRNPTSFSFGIVTASLDISIIVLYFAHNLKYDYTVFVFLVAQVISTVIGKIIFKKLVAKTKEQLTEDDETKDYTEFFDSIGVCKNSLTAMKYIVVGLAELCDLFVNGQLIDYIITHTNNEKILSLCLQVITYFPSDSNKLNMLYKKLIRKRKLTFINRFLIFQIMEVKTRRLVSSSKDTLDIYNKLHAMNSSCKYGYQQFWDKTQCHTSYMVNLSNSVMDAERYFKYALMNNPNNIRLTNEYANFLAECLCDFKGAIIETMRVDAIVDGNNFNADMSFRSLVHKFPRYLKDEIYDYKGKRVKKNENSEVFTVQGSEKSSEQFDGSLDAENEEIVGAKLLRDSRLRLALHNSIADLRPPHTIYVSIFSITFFIIELVFFITFFVYMKSKFSWRRENYSDIQSVANSAFYSNYAQYFILMKFLNMSKKIGSKQLINDTTVDDTEPLINKENTLTYSSFLSVEKSLHALKTVMDSIEVQAFNANPYDFFPEIVNENMSYIVCQGGKVSTTIPSSLPNSIITSDFLTNQLAGDMELDYHDALFFGNDYCQISMNVFGTVDRSIEAMNQFLKYSQSKTADYRKNINYFMISGLILIGFFASVPLTCLVFSYRRMITNAFKVLLNLPTKDKEDAKIPLVIGQGNSSEEQPAIQKTVVSHYRSLMTLLYFIDLIGVLLVFAFLCKESKIMNKSIDNMETWFYYAAKLFTIASELGNNAIYYIILANSSANVVGTNKLKMRTRQQLELLVDTNDILINGNGSIKPSIGYDAIIDDIESENQCDLGHDPDSVHDMYACSGLITQISMLKTIIMNILNNPDVSPGSFTDEYSYNLLHILEYHLYPTIASLTDEFADLIEKKFDNSMLISDFLLALGIVLCVINFGMAFTYKTSMVENYKFILVLFQHLPPPVVANRTEVLSFLRHSKRVNKEQMPISKSIVYGASESIIITNQNAVVEIINQSVTENIGLTPDQMLGQQIINFVAIQNHQNILSQIDLMVQGQGPLFCQDHIEMINDAGKPVPFAMTMIGMKENQESNEIKSIVFILTNEQDEIKKRNDAEQAKAKSEKLLYQILPKDIVIRLNRGEKDISFAIPNSTIFFIDIVKFSTYASSLSPAEIMANLSLVFATFDKIVSKFKSITKIKLIGDVYMAAAGLFSEGEDLSTESKTSAIEAVTCCLECVSAMTDINTKLESSLEVRVGVNSGGPLIGGVLGTDKPTFDIIGDPINVAARLQSTDVPGNVQISEETKALIESTEFIIEERGEVFLKGKGNRKTYFVRRPNKQEENTSFTINMLSGKL